MTRTLVVTNDFPPRQGGIESFLSEVVRRLPPADVVVYARGQQGDKAYDAELDFPVVRNKSGIMVPEPRVAHRAAEIAKGEGCTSVWFGAAAPLGLLAPGLRRVGVTRTVATTHGHEVWWARTPGARQLLRRIGEVNDVVTYLGDYTRNSVGAALSPEARARMARLTPGVDTSVFTDGVGGPELRSRLGLADRPVAVCVSRLVPRKGQDTLVRAWAQVREAVPGAVLLLVGGGSDEFRLRRLVAELGLAEHVVMTGAVPPGELPAHYGAGDVFAMPCRSRRAGLEVEGLGMVFIEAAACGLPVVVGTSGGSPDALVDGVTGHLVHGEDVALVARRVAQLLGDLPAAARMGRRGQAWVRASWEWDGVVHQLRRLLGAADADQV